MKSFSVENALGFSPKIDAKAGASVRRVSLDEAAFEKAVAYWRNRGEEDLPSLRSLSVTREKSGAKALNLVLDLGDRGAFLCVETPVKGDLPDLAEIWPHGRWWQEEAATFAEVRFVSAREIRGIKWRLA